MSDDKPPTTSVGHTLAGGVQEVSAILPLLGTEQCEKHTGSALVGGYLYAAALPLSIFGSLGIIKAGIAVLISSISISGPNISIRFSRFRPYVKYLGWEKWLGGRLLKNAGFELTGVVAPLIGMDGDRFSAETRLMEMLKEKHIDNPEKITVQWKSRRWNIILVIFTIVGGALGLTPYIALLLGPASWRPNGIHLPWLFPALRVVGSCIAAISCQLIIQFRVISLMKNRIMFMIIHRQLKFIPKELDWDDNLPAEQSIWNLEQYLVKEPRDWTHRTAIRLYQYDQQLQQHTAPLRQRTNASLVPPPSPIPKIGTHSFNIQLRELQQEHFPTPIRDAVFTTLLWILLALSLPATVAGYIGCFTLVGTTPTQGNGPLIWVGLEATLSVIRILIWASNPSFDEDTDITLKLELSDDHPIFPTDNYNPLATNRVTAERKPFDLVPEREFLERITPFTGPLDQFPMPNNITLYFTLISNPDNSSMNQVLLSTVFDLNMRLGVSFRICHEPAPVLSFEYWDVTVKYDTVLRTFQGYIQSKRLTASQPWRFEDITLFTSLQKYHRYVFDAFVNSKNAIKERHKLSADSHRYSELPLRWDFSTQAQTNDGFQAENPINKNSQHVHRIGFEYQSKHQLIMTWASWIVKTMGTIRSQTRIDCDKVLEGETSQKVEEMWELGELDTQLVWEWTRRELVLLTLSLKLEDILESKTWTCIKEISRVREPHNGLIDWMCTGLATRQQYRIERERESAKQRMQKAMTSAHEEAEGEGRPWQDDGFLPQWTQAIEFIERQWSVGIINRQEALTEAEDELKMLIQNQGEQQRQLDNKRYTFVEQFKKQIRHEHWSHQRKVEEDMMKATVERIRTLKADSKNDDLYLVYRYPEADETAASKFVNLYESSSEGKACTATVYSLIGFYSYDQKAIDDVIAKSTTRSVIGVNPKFVGSIPPNDHLLFLQSSGTQEPAFVKENREEWWKQQTPLGKNASIFYFSPKIVNHNRSCSTLGGATLAHIFVFITGTTPSSVQVRVLHSESEYPTQPKTLSVQENGKVLASISGSKLTSGSYRWDHCPLFKLDPGEHDLELVPDSSFYCLRDIFVTISDSNIPTVESDQGVFATIQDPHSEGKST